MDVKDRIERAKYWATDQWQRVPKGTRVRLLVLGPLLVVLLIAVFVVYRPRHDVGPPQATPQAEAVQAIQDYDFARLRAMSIEELREEETRRAGEVERAKGIGHPELVAAASEELDRVQQVITEKTERR